MDHDASSRQIASLATFSIWLMWLIAMALMSFTLFIQLSTGVMLKELIRSYQLNAFSAGLLSSAFYIVYNALQIPAGILTDRFGARRLLSIGAMTCAFGCFLFSISDTFLPAWIGRLFMGMGSACNFVCALHIIGEWFEEKRYAFLVGILETSGMITVVIGNIYLAHLLQYFHWRDLIILMGFTVFIMGIAAHLFVHDQPTAPVSINPPGLRSIAHNKIFWQNGLHAGLMFAVLTAFSTFWGIHFFMSAFDIDLKSATTLNTVTLISVAIGSPLMGILFPYLQQVKKFQQHCLLLQMLLIIILIYFTPHHVILLTTLLFCIGLLVSTYVISYSVAGRLSARENHSTAIGFTNTIAGIAPLLLPMIGWLLDIAIGGNSMAFSVTHYRYAFSILPLLMLILLAISYWDDAQY